MEFLEEITNNIILFIQNLGILGSIISCFIIILESLVPIVPLCVFISLNFFLLGDFLGLLISYFCTSIGCIISFILCRYWFRNFFEKRFRKNKKVNKLMIHMDTIKLRNLVLIMAIPFTPAFAINIAGGLSKISFKKYVIAIAIGKIFMVFFWGFVGTTLIESIKHPIKLLYTALIVLAAYLVSLLVSKKFNLD